jgi:hypothetical protein
MNRVSVKESTDASPVKMLEDCIQRIRLERVRKQRESVRRQLQKAEAARDADACSRFQRADQELIEEEKRIQRFRITTS